jgi:drug/metabolite transporter (DMT)-like permease
MNRTQLKKTELINWVTLIFLAFVWGTSFILIKKGLIAFSDYQVASLRISISGLAFVPIIIWQFKKINWKKWDRFLLVGITGSGIPPFLFAAAQTEISSSLAGVLNGLTTFFTLIIALLFFNQQWERKRAIGVFIGLIGASVIILYNNKIEGQLFYAMMVVVAAILYGFNGNFIKWFFDDENPLHISAVSLGLMMPAALTFLLMTDFTHVVQSHPDAMMSLGSVTILALMSTVVASVIFFRLIQKTNAVFGSGVTYLIPFVAVLWGVWDGESFYLIYFACLLLILLGVYLTRN